MNFQKMCRCRAATAMEISDSSMEFFVPWISAFIVTIYRYYRIFNRGEGMRVRPNKETIFFIMLVNVTLTREGS
jgi:hypothetical protein